VIEELAPQELARRLKSRPGEMVLLDVREALEREQASLEPSVHIPMQEVPWRLEELPKDRTIVVFCHTGGRSALVAGFLDQQGYGRVANLRGGIDAWSREVDPSVPRYG
jgi:rhodanese-related sulfurtransferase